MSVVTACAIWLVVGFLLGIPVGRLLRRARDAPPSEFQANGSVSVSNCTAGGDIVAIAKARNKIDQ